MRRAWRKIVPLPFDESTSKRGKEVREAILTGDKNKSFREKPIAKHTHFIFGTAIASHR
jgi:hypothetical protein